ncbi:hypothetical protein SARC_03593 [Sphaeroforma arctica JP610]|uniref:F-box domain-containing protein n=1 Tax=Sphaeroforma arctica JP610 TaxID=667725 RepID=A0A0L0G5R5_9EUKA|nr:hypothetical protein SARC_03593 [Sphaeroforma arctica JP610]KNC84171.1 hypothetical protein SARC_03593 [Sphaeroforma arctica JP610]|eukprot:XP_014158073.1 hypothetical protein SARC_03593 [Sphaeroforma arctica JP610]
MRYQIALGPFGGLYHTQRQMSPQKCHELGHARAISSHNMYIKIYHRMQRKELVTHAEAKVQKVPLSIQALHADLLLKVCSYLELSEIPALARTCKSMRESVSHPCVLLRLLEMKLNHMVVDVCKDSRFVRPSQVRALNRLLRASPLKGGNLRFHSLAMPNELFIAACKTGSTELVISLLTDERVGVSTRGNWAMQTACASGQTDVVQLLLRDTRVDPTASESLSLRAACENGHAVVVQLLLDDGRADPSARQYMALIRSYRRGHKKVWMYTCYYSVEGVYAIIV